MSKDVVPGEPNLNLESKVIEGAVKAVADLYSAEINMSGFGIMQKTQRLKINEGRSDKAWREVAKKFPRLEIQILGLRSALRRGRIIEEKYSPQQIDEISEPLTQGIEFKDERTKFFLQDIFFRRIMYDMNHEEVDPFDIFRRSEAYRIREELGLRAGVCNLTLEQVVRAAIVGPLSLTRQTAPLIRNS